MDDATLLLREAADQEHPGAAVSVGWIHDQFGPTRDDRLAFLYYEKAAQQGHTASLFNTGLLRESGRGCEQSYALAADATR